MLHLLFMSCSRSPQQVKTPLNPLILIPQVCWGYYREEPYYILQLSSNQPFPAKCALIRFLQKQKHANMLI